MKPRIRTTRGAIGTDVFILLPDLTGYPSVNMSDSADAGDNTIDTQDAATFAKDEYIVIGKPGEAKTEIQQISSITSSLTINLVGTLTFDHQSGEDVTFIPFNQVRIQSAPDATTFSTLDTVTIELQNPEHYFQDTTGLATATYRALFRNSTSGNNSDNSDILIATGYTDDTVFSVKKRAIEGMGLKLADVYSGNAFDGKVNDNFLNESLFELRRDVHDSLKRWVFREEYDKIVAAAVAGTNSFTLPTDLQDRNSASNIYSLRIGSKSFNLDPRDKATWDSAQVNMIHNTLGVAITSTGDTSITLTDSGDFADSGSISIVTAGTVDTIDYTANDRTTNVLSGVTNISVTHVISRDVWQNPQFGRPSFYSVWEGEAHFNVPLEESMEGENISMDYYKTIVKVDSDADTFDEPEFDMYIYGLKWKMKQARDEGLVSDEDPDFKKYEKKLNKMIAKERSDRPIQFIPDVPVTDHFSSDRSSD